MGLEPLELPTWSRPQPHTVEPSLINESYKNSPGAYVQIPFRPAISRKCWSWRCNPSSMDAPQTGI